MNYAAFHSGKIIIVESSDMPSCGVRFRHFSSINMCKKEDFAHARASFLRLWARAFSPKSIFAPVRPLSLSRLNFPHSLICPNTASGSIGRLLRCFNPCPLVSNSLARAL